MYLKGMISLISTYSSWERRRVWILIIQILQSLLVSSQCYSQKSIFLDRSGLSRQDDRDPPVPHSLEHSFFGSTGHERYGLSPLVSLLQLPRRVLGTSRMLLEVGQAPFCVGVWGTGRSRERINCSQDIMYGRRIKILRYKN